uniref:Uncharacterized protein n=1 Tax=Sphenodon punctatus TaxID=8508 RepID=A0A8D0HH39_SPHPU
NEVNSPKERDPLPLPSPLLLFKETPSAACVFPVPATQRRWKENPSIPRPFRASLNGCRKGAAGSHHPVDLQFPQNASSPLFRAGPNAVALYLGNSSSFSLGTAASATNLLDALVYTSNRSTAPELLEILTPGRPIFYEDERHQQGDVSVSRCSCCSVTRDASAYALSSPTPGQFNDCPSKRFSQAISFCLHGADCQQWSPGSNEIQRVLAHSLDAQCNCGVSAVYFKGKVYLYWQWCSGLG